MIPTRNKDRESEKQFLKQKTRYRKAFGKDPEIMEIIKGNSALTFESMMGHFRGAMAKGNNAGFYDAEFWLELARSFNLCIQIPEKLTQMQSRCRAKEEAEKWQARMAATVYPPEPILPTPHYSYREENTFEMNEIVSEHWVGVAARNEAEAIESMWGDLADCGFWDNTSWQ